MTVALYCLLWQAGHLAYNALFSRRFVPHQGHSFSVTASTANDARRFFDLNFSSNYRFSLQIFHSVRDSTYNRYRRVQMTVLSFYQLISVSWSLWCWWNFLGLSVTFVSSDPVPARGTREVVVNNSYELSIDRQEENGYGKKNSATLQDTPGYYRIYIKLRAFWNKKGWKVVGGGGVLGDVCFMGSRTQCCFSYFPQMRLKRLTLCTV